MSLPIVAFIFARGGSKGVPHKNIRSFLGRPLIARAIDVARESVLIDRVVVSTEDEEIAEIARACGAEVPFMRPAELASDSAPEFLVWKHALSALAAVGEPVGTFLSIPATSPLRSVEDVDACIHLLQTEDTDLVLTVTPARRHPMFNMVTVGVDGLVRLAMTQDQPIQRRQDAPPVYDVCTVGYAAQPEFVLRSKALLGGRTRAVVVPEERSLDIDTEMDFLFAEFLASRRKEKG
ncbi:MAG: acylneuraminate cytidylyltransferase family protein [Gallionellaceae bacterium]